MICEQASSGSLGGIIFFKHNIVSKEQIKSLISHFRSISKDQLIFAVDQEGGLVQRLNELNGFKRYPKALTVSADYSLEEAYGIYSEMASDLADVGFNMVFGPVVDLHDENSKAIGRHGRSYSRDPSIVIEYAQEFIKAMNDKGVITCIKHFPGHGLASGDTHHGLVDVTNSFKEDELIPFQSIVKTGYDQSIMVSHVVHRDYSEKPATMSKELLERLIPQDFKGLLISDDMMMGAVLNNYPLATACVDALRAGVNMLIVSCNGAANKGIRTHNAQEENDGLIDDDLKITLEKNKIKINAFKEKIQ
jgi:beta-N-acetylhexosaminidase